MSELAVLVPVLARPQNVAPLLDSIEAATPGARVVFLADQGDGEGIAAIQREQRSLRRAMVIDLAEAASANYSAKINRGVRLTTEPYVFTGADDLDFHPVWFEAAKARMRDRIGCVGTQDLCNRRVIRGEHATHFLLARWYAEQPCIDGSPGPLFEGYEHNFVDDELLGTARKRGAYAFAADSIVEHRHPLNGKAPDDEVYQKGLTTFRADQLLCRGRRRLWAE